MVRPDKEELHLGRKQCHALSLLMLSPRFIVAPDVLIDFLWAEKLPANPLNSLQDLIKRLRLAAPGSIHLYWDRTVKTAQALEDVFSGIRNLRPE